MCIIGAGAAGITLASELDGLRLQGAVTRSRGPQVGREPRRLLPWVRDHSASGSNAVSARLFGGTTGIWGGRCVAFDPIDLQLRDHVANSGWPISYEELTEVLPGGDALLRRRQASISQWPALCTRAYRRYRRFDGSGRTATKSSLVDRIERYSLPTDFGRVSQKDPGLAECDGLVGRALSRLRPGAGSERVEAAEVADRQGRRRTVRGDSSCLPPGASRCPGCCMLSDPDGPGSAIAMITWADTTCVTSRTLRPDSADGAGSFSISSARLTVSIAAASCAFRPRLCRRHRL